MKRYIINIVRRIFLKELPTPLGRWQVVNSNSQINYKIDLSNEDHCGSCGQYALSKIEEKKIDNQQKDTPSNTI